MASSDDEDVERAIALSLGKPWPVDKNSDKRVVDLTGDGEDDDDNLRQAIALSLQDSERNENIISASSPSLLVSPRNTQQSNDTKLETKVVPSASQPQKPLSGLLGLDRKTMEQERLVRLGKRKRAASPERPSKQVTKPSGLLPVMGKAQNMPSSQSPIQYPHGTIKRTWAHKHPRTNDIKIEEVLQASTLNIAVLSSFQWDLDWLSEKIDPYKVKQIWIMSAKYKGEDLRDKWRQEIIDSGIPNFKPIFPRMDGQVQHMHSKLMLLFHPTHLRIVIPTANMTKVDWGETNKDPRTKESWQPAVMENSLFLIDLPRYADGHIDKKSELSRFGKVLIDYLEAQEVGQNVTDGLLKFDFSGTNSLGFVHSIAGSHPGQGSPVTGFPGLRRAVRDLKLHDVKLLELDYATSSLGTAKASFLEQIYSAACGQSFATFKAPADVLNRIRIYFPTHDTVADSTGGADCGGIITLNRSHFASPAFPKKCMRDHKSTRTGVLSHNKLLFARGRKMGGVPFAWVYVGSANLTEAAWGSQKVLKSGKEGSLNIRNWECGALIPVSGESLKGLELKEDEVPPMSVFHDTLEVPFQYPAEPYGDRQPWFFIQE